MKISQLVDEIIKKIPAAIFKFNRYIWCELNLQLCVYALVACHWWYNANLNKAAIRRHTYAPVAQMLLDQGVM